MPRKSNPKPKLRVALYCGPDLEIELAAANMADAARLAKKYSARLAQEGRAPTYIELGERSAADEGTPADDSGQKST